MPFLPRRNPQPVGIHCGQSLHSYLSYALRLNNPKDGSRRTTDRLLFLQQFRRNVAAICSNGCQHGAVQPHVHLGGVAHFLCRTP